MNSFYRVEDGGILDSKGHHIVLHGVNVGGWLMPEGYLVQAPNRAYHVFRQAFEKQMGEDALIDLECAFRDHWIVENDIKRMADLRFNCIRVPFHYQLITTKDDKIDEIGIDYLDRIIKWAEKYSLGVILDLHAAPGGQSTDWHCDSDGQARFWQSQDFQRWACNLWGYLAHRYRDNKTIIGYDILNEADTSSTLLNQCYHKMVKAIRSVDSNHIIFLEGNKWATDLTVLDPIDDDNVVYSVHYYEPIDFVFNLVPNLRHPLEQWHKRDLKKLLRERIKPARDMGIPILVGEYGISWRNNQFNEEGWLADTLTVFKELGLHRTYWTYKSTKNTMFPDGIYAYYPNDPWVHRHGPLTGWDTWHLHWPEHKKRMIQSWQTEHFQANDGMLKILKKFAS